MLVRSIGLVLCIWLAGCATGGGKLPDDGVRYYGKTMAFIDICTRRGALPSTAAHTKRAIQEYLSLVNFNKEVYRQTYRFWVDGTRTATQEDLSNGCISFAPHLSYVAPKIQYNLARAHRNKADYRQGMQELTQAFSDMGNNTRAMGESALRNSTYKPIQPQLTPPNNTTTGYTHYTVNTDEGIKQCHRSSTGYTFCD